MIFCCILGTISTKPSTYFVVVLVSFAIGFFDKLYYYFFIVTPCISPDYSPNFIFLDYLLAYLDNCCGINLRLSYTAGANKIRLLIFKNRSSNLIAMYPPILEPYTAIGLSFEINCIACEASSILF